MGEQLTAVTLPNSFSIEDLHRILDKDGDGELDKTEFIDGMQCLVYADDFQRHCLLALAVAELKRDLRRIGKRIDSNFHTIDQAVKQLNSGDFDSQEWSC